MNILSDAEYRRLTQTEQLAYWRARYEEKAERLERTERELHRLQTVLVRIRAELPAQ